MLRDYPDPAFRRRASIIVSSLEATPTQRVLDVGCGRGKFEVLISTLFSRIELVAIDLDAIRLGLARAKGARSRIHVVRADATHLPSRPRTFERIIASEILEHVHDDNEALKEIKRVLGNGFVLFSVPHARYPFSWDPLNFILEHTLGIHLPSTVRAFAGIWASHQRLYTEAEFLNKVSRTGLRPVRVWRTTEFCFPFCSLLLNLVASFLDRFGGRLEFVRNPVTQPSSPLAHALSNPIRVLDKFSGNSLQGHRFVNLVVKSTKSWED
jgi:ubiquinone/menaquinone biosynthesis C-methylase UbiE